MREWLRAMWCSWTHGGGRIKRDPQGRVNWQCDKCHTWADPVSADDEAKVVDSDISWWNSRVHADPIAHLHNSVIEIAETYAVRVDGEYRYAKDGKASLTMTHEEWRQVAAVLKEKRR